MIFFVLDELTYIIFFFFFQAEDGIRDKLVTGVQTCALPIFVVAVVFAAMGGLVLALAAEGNPMGSGGPQLAVGRWLTTFFTRVLSFLDPVPDAVLGLALLGLAAGFVTFALRGGRDAA